MLRQVEKKDKEDDFGSKCTIYMDSPFVTVHVHLDGRIFSVRIIHPKTTVRFVALFRHVIFLIP